jgi:predicted AlkP superfamily pyrophosphatase or phosphodiesterase
LPYLGCARPAQPPPEGTPRLVLFLVVDQMRYDYLERVDPLLTGGLRWLLDHGVSFTDAQHDHAATNTAPGHATLATGLFPGHSGIVSNWWVDRKSGEWVYCVGDERYGTSPANLLAPTLADRLKKRYPTARTFGVSGKDRGAVLVAGWYADGAFWYDHETGAMTTSPFYRRPEWLTDFDDEDLPAEWFGRAWDLLPVDPEKARAAGIEDLDEGPFARVPPHPLGWASLMPEQGFYGSIYDTPFLDEYVARFARRLLNEERLGTDAVPDFLGVSFSALDTVGHEYGPNSPEVLDVILRLDRLLADLLAAVDEQVGLENVLISFSADHGVVPLPELRQLHGLPGRRVGAEDIRCVQQAGREILERYGVDPWVEQSRTLDPEVVAEHELDPKEVLSQTATLLEKCPLVERVWTATELENDPPAQLSEVERRYRNGYNPERSPHLDLQLGEYDVGMSGWEVTHGSVYRYDSHVPLIVVRPGGLPGRISEPVRTVDLVPTLAELLGLPVPEGLDGVSRAGELSPAEAPRVASRR